MNGRIRGPCESTTTARPRYARSQGATCTERLTFSGVSVRGWPTKVERRIAARVSKAAAQAVKDCDLFIAVGARFSDRVIGYPKTFARNARIIHIDIDPAEINKNIKVYHQIIGDSTEIMKRLIKLLPRQNHGEWLSYLKQQDKIYSARQKGTEQFPLTPRTLIETLDELTGNTDIGPSNKSGFFGCA